MSYQQKRWECVVIYSAGMQVGTGDAPEQAVYDALEKSFRGHRGGRKEQKRMTSCKRWKQTGWPELWREIAGFTDDRSLDFWISDFTRGQAGRLAFDVEYLTRHYQFGRCLDVGAAPFIFECLLRKARPAMEIVSVDLAPWRFPHVEALLGVRAVELNIEDGDYNEVAALGKFDCVVFAEVFEHMRRDLLGTVRRLASLLTPEGILYLTTPNGLGLYGVWEKLHGRTGSDPVFEWSKLETLGHMGHVREYSASEVRRILETSGLAVVEQFYRHAISRRSLKSRAAGLVKSCLTTVMPYLGDELVFVAKRRQEKGVDLVLASAEKTASAVCPTIRDRPENHRAK
jgi:2-polyprenyl-3-methyl-5-hydroxy-6-metoxy-1,4-benzoquinol methylase